MAKTCKYDGVEIEVVNWQRYQLRSDSKTHKWFKLDNEIATGPSLFGMNCEHKWLLITIFCMTSKRFGEPIKWNSTYIEAITGVGKATQEQAIDLFINNGTLKSNIKLLHLTSSNILNPCLEREKEREKEAKIETDEKLDLDFEFLYKKFPKKLGKAEGIKKAIKDIKSQADFDALSIAIDRFIGHHKRAGTKAEFVPYFSTFMTSWRDWLENETGTTSPEIGGNDLATWTPKVAGA